MIDVKLVAYVDPLVHEREQGKVTPATVIARLDEVAHLGVLLEDLFPEYARHMVTIVVNPKGTAKAWPAPPRPEEGPPRGSHGGEAVRTEAPRPDRSGRFRGARALRGAGHE